MTRVELELRPAELVAHWKRCGQTADWLASYLVHDFEPAVRETVKNVLSTVINELLENAVKFCADKQTSIKFSASHGDESLRFDSWNTASETHARLLEGTLESLDHTSADSLFTQRIAAGKAAGAPGIGLIIVKRDYDARLSAKLTPRADGAVDVHVSVELDIARVTRS
jgi:hypothetical protein